MKKALMYATVASMIDLFNKDNIRMLQSLGYQVDVAANFEEGNVTSNERVIRFMHELDEMNVKHYHIPIPRSIKNITDLIKSYKMTTLLKNTKQYDLVHCHTPVGSAICRFTFRNSETRVIYTAHGFHFYKGAPVKNWLIYYPIERFLSNYTNTLITINQEDYKNAMKFNADKKIYVPGVGIDTSKYSKNNRDIDYILRKRLNIKENNVILLSVGELNHNKNHKLVLQAISKLNDDSVHYVIAGQGPLESYLRNLAIELQISNQIHLLGYCEDISSLLKSADIFVFPSIREGLSLSLMEAMSSGLPVIASDIRGNRDLIDDNKGGYLFPTKDSIYITSKLCDLTRSIQDRKKFGEYNQEKIKEYSKRKVNKKMLNIYKESM